MSLRFLTLEEVLEIHELQISTFGGSAGVRDQGLLESALAQPQATFGEQFLHSNVYEMAAAYLFHIVQNHPFLDGNKRTGTAAAIVFLDLNGIELDPALDNLSENTDKTQLETIVLKTALGEISKKELESFFKTNTSKPV